MFRRSTPSPEHQARLEAEWQRVQAADAAARRAAWQATRRALRRPGLWLDQAGHALVCLAMTVAGFYAIACAVILAMYAAWPEVRGAGQPVVDLANWLSGLVLVWWLPFRGFPRFRKGSPIAATWERAYSEARRGAWGKPSSVS